jgi:hypothetical protein
VTATAATAAALALLDSAIADVPDMAYVHDHLSDLAAEVARLTVYREVLAQAERYVPLLDPDDEWAEGYNDRLDDLRSTVAARLTVEGLS